MTNSFDEPGTGERVHAQRRRRFWLTWGGLALLGAIGGLLLVLFVAGDVAARQPPQKPLYGWLGLAAVFLFAIVFSVATWRFFATVDELELADNLWGSTVGFYVYAFLFPLWWVLHLLQHAPEPDDWIIFFVAMGSGLAGYGIRKWLHR
jgi:ABC-type spermidine/putrescine transport system permease subunit II